MRNPSVRQMRHAARDLHWRVGSSVLIYSVCFWLAVVICVGMSLVVLKSIDVLVLLLQFGWGQSIRTGEGQFLSRTVGSTLVPGRGPVAEPMEFVRTRLLPLESSELVSMSERGLFSAY